MIDAPRALAVALEAARDAGQLLLQTLGKLDPAAMGRKSSLSDLVTRADVESERLVVGRLRQAFPAHAIEAEEEVRDQRTADGPRWFLDPLDGTVNFVHEIPLFAVSLALYDGARPEVAVVHAPKLGETFSAVRGQGAFLNEVRLRVSDTSALSEALLATGFPYVRGDRERDNRANFDALLPDVRGMRRMGSAALDLAYTAAGRFDGYWELGLAPHDVAAGVLLVREAGGLVSDVDGGEDWLRAGHIVAGGPRVHALLRPRIRHGQTGHDQTGRAKTGH